MMTIANSVLLVALLATSLVTAAPKSGDEEPAANDGSHGVDPEKAKEHLSHWGYTGEHGVDHWAHNYESCGGERQSPINIKVTDTKQNEELDNIDLLMPTDMSEGKITMFNNGHSVSNTLDTEIYITGGGLIDQYQAAGFHFHWGGDSSRGSEHTVDGKAFPLEMHIVCYDVEKYPTLPEAVKEVDALAVLGVLFEVSAEDNLKLNPVIEYLSDVRTPGKESAQTLPLIDIRELLPGNTRDYYRYLGSLTTPGCFETVIWTIFKTPQKISESQLTQFRMLYDSKEAVNQLVDNYRPTQPLHSRTVSRSFPVQTDEEPEDKNPAVNPPEDGAAGMMTTSVAVFLLSLLAALHLI